MFAFCGIANPEAFRRTLLALGCDPAVFRAFPDHARYTEDDFVTIANDADRAGAAAILTTEKDIVKLSGFVSLLPVCYLIIEADVSALMPRIMEVCQRRA